MSATPLVQIACDGPALGLTCTTDPVTSTTNLIRLRSHLRRKKGWTRRHTGDTQVDLCPTCTPRATLTPHRCGRPPKSKETDA